MAKNAFEKFQPMSTEEKTFSYFPPVERTSWITFKFCNCGSRENLNGLNESYVVLDMHPTKNVLECPASSYNLLFCITSWANIFRVTEATHKWNRMRAEWPEMQLNPSFRNDPALGNSLNMSWVLGKSWNYCLSTVARRCCNNFFGEVPLCSNRFVNLHGMACWTTARWGVQFALAYYEGGVGGKPRRGNYNVQDKENNDSAKLLCKRIRKLRHSFHDGYLGLES